MRELEKALEQIEQHARSARVRELEIALEQIEQHAVAEAQRANSLQMRLIDAEAKVGPPACPRAPPRRDAPDPTPALCEHE